MAWTAHALRFSWRLAPLLALASIALPGAAHAATAQQVMSECGVGSELMPLTVSGSTPKSIDGVSTVSPRAAKCVIDRLPTLLVIAPMRDYEQLPNTVPMPLLALPTLDGADQAKVLAELTELTGGDKARPILIYCHHASCALSADGSRNLVRLGFKKVMWLREGLNGWLAERYPLTPYNAVRSAKGDPAYAIWSAAFANATNCDEEKIESCNRALPAYERLVEAPDLPPANRKRVTFRFFEAATKRAKAIRTRFGAQQALPEIQRYYDMVKRFVAQGRTGSLSEHAMVSGEYAIAALETGQADLAARLLAEVRTDAVNRFKRLDAERGNEAALASIRQTMVSMEQFEKDIAGYAGRKVMRAPDGQPVTQLAPFARLASQANDQTILWIYRSGVEGVSAAGQLHAFYRYSTVMENQGDLADRMGDKKAARKSYGLATLVCDLKAESREAVAYTRQCNGVKDKYAKATPEFERWSKQQAKKEMEAWLALLNDQSLVDFYKNR